MNFFLEFVLIILMKYVFDLEWIVVIVWFVFLLLGVEFLFVVVSVLLGFGKW